LDSSDDKTIVILVLHTDVIGGIIYCLHIHKILPIPSVCVAIVLFFFLPEEHTKIGKIPGECSQEIYATNVI